MVFKRRFITAVLSGLSIILPREAFANTQYSGNPNERPCVASDLEGQLYSNTNLVPSVDIIRRLGENATFYRLFAGGRAYSRFYERTMSIDEVRAQMTAEFRSKSVGYHLDPNGQIHYAVPKMPFKRNVFYSGPVQSEYCAARLGDTPASNNPVYPDLNFFQVYSNGTPGAIDRETRRPKISRFGAYNNQYMDDDHVKIVPESSIPARLR